MSMLGAVTHHRTRQTGGTMAHAKAWIARNRFLAIFGGMALALVLGAAFVGVASATNSPSFCRAACHEMKPYHDAWATGPHKDISCIECHVDPGSVAQLKHKVVALGEVATHFRGDTSFPREVSSEVPGERCIRCHSKISIDSVGFDHAVHAKRGPCTQCHADAGHKVTVEALKAAGYYSGFTGDGASSESTTAIVDGGVADVPGHKSISCSRCHVMSANTCSSCHKPQHPVRGECNTCHATGEKFIFTHPVNRTDCATCHTPKPTHTKTTPKMAANAEAPCTTCHKQAGVKWSFTHPSKKSDCESCHARPAKHRAGTCTQCHKSGISWKFTHPAAKSSCDSCHNRPAGHRSGSCTTCHSVGSTWAFKHPGSRSSCASCHNRPSGHQSGSCTTCHSVGSSWAFRHPGNGSSCSSCHNRPSKHRSGSCRSCHSVGKRWTFSHPGNGASCTSCHKRPSGHKAGSCSSCHSVGKRWVFRHGSSSKCSSCHKAPSKHYGTSCSKCHSPKRSWKSASFRHPSIRGGEHRSTSFSCVKCHPGDGRGPGHYCSCHGNTTGPDDD